MQVATKQKASVVNLSGITPLEYKVLVRPSVDDVGLIKNEKTGFSLIKPADLEERDKHAAMEGVVVAVAKAAFTYEETAEKPPIGSVVIFARYSGVTIKGADGIEYRIMNDKDVVAVRA